jgi:arylsulfatase A-like enzyme
MTRRDLLRIGGAASTQLARSARAAEDKRPNFLFLIADDLTYGAVHALGNSEVETPNIDRLSQRGCTFNHCFHQGSWSGAVCIPSRTMLNTGLTAFRARAHAETTPLWGETLGKAGYRTYIAGKWHLSTPNLNRSFQVKGPVSGGMFESTPDVYDRPRPGNDTWKPWDTSLKGQWLHTSEWQKAPVDEIRHSAAIWADEAVRHLGEIAKGADPFFVYVGFNSPHDPRQAPREYVERYPAARIGIPPNYLPEHPFDNGDLRVRDERLAPFPRTREAVQRHRSEYYAHITYMDAQIGRILDALDASGAASNTYIVFTADHGLAVGQHGLMGKQNLYDHSVRMPLMIAGPGIRSGTRVGHMVYQHSVFATTCELAGVAVPRSVEFPGLVDLLKGGSSAKHDAMFCYYQDFQRSVRTSGHKLIVYPKVGVTQLFDLEKDPWEMRNLADDRKYAVVRKSLLERLHGLQRELGDELKV